MKRINGTKTYAAALLALIVSGCGNSTENTSTVEQHQPQNIEEAILQLEKSGQLPLLDRSESISGIDANRNEIRDDIEAYISAMPDTEQQKNRLTKFHKAITATMLVDIKDEAELRNVGNELSKSAHCLSYVYGAEVAFKKGKEIQKLTVNTKPRVLAYMKYNDAMDGRVFFMPPKNICE